MHQISFFPYFPSPRPIDEKLGRVHLFSFWEHKERYITNSLLRAKIEEFFSMYVDHDLTVSKNMTVAIIDGNYDFVPLNDESIMHLYRFSLALLFCSLTKNTQDAAWASDHFALFRRDFSLAENSIRYQVGSYVRHAELGLKLGERYFVKPDHITNGIRYIFDKKLLGAFIKAIDANNSDDDALFIALEWIKDAHTNVDGFSVELRPVIMATAFETIFDLPRNDKGNELADRLEKLLDVDQMYDRHSNQTGLPKIYPVIGMKKKRFNFTMYGKWAKEFYGGLRSTIVHTGKASQAEWMNHSGKSHFEIALAIMNQCFYRLLERKGYLVYEPTDFQGINVDKFLTESHLRQDTEESIS